MKQWMKSTIMLTTMGLLVLFCLVMGRFALGEENQETTSVEESTEKVQLGIVNVEKMNIRIGPGTSYSQLTDSQGNKIQLTSGKIVEIIGSKLASNGSVWYQVRFDYNEETDMVGYGFGSYITAYEIVEDPEFDAYLEEQGFPADYQESLRILHSIHPTWIFLAQHTNLVWADAVAAESKDGQSLAYYSSPTSWKYPADGNYDWKNDAWIGKDGSHWHAASTEIVQYYMDPRNFLTERGIFQFELNSYNEKLHVIEEVQRRLNGTFMEGEVKGEGITYAQTFMEAAAASGVSPYMLVARCIQEMGVAGTSRIISGTVPGYENLYNYFDIGAYTTAEHDLITNGLIYASKTDERYLLPWNTRYRSLVGGSIWIGSTYISKGQDTLYLQKFNVQGQKPYTHQYMTNIQAASNESSTMYGTYSDLEQAFIFKIPVFLEMPEQRSVCPTKDGNPNPYLSSLSVAGFPLTPAFDYKTLEYDLVVPYIVDKIQVEATAISSLTTITGTGVYDLEVGDNDVTIVSTAEYGNQVSYVIHISREEDTGEEGEFFITAYRFELMEDGNNQSFNCLLGVLPETTVTDFFANIRVFGSTTCQLLDSRGNVKTEGYVATGDRLQTDTQSIPVLIYGDVNCDGQISALDLLYVRRHLLNTAALKDMALLSAEVRKDGVIDALDMLYIKRHILGTAELIQ